MRKAITIMWLLMGSLCYAQAQTITIKNKDSKQPIELVSLMSNNPKANTKTNAKGQADITAFKGAERIVLYALGYKTIAKSYAELEATPNEVLLEVSSIGLDEVVVSATRWGQTSRNVPSKITSISAKDVALQNPQTAADLLNVSGEVFIQKSQQGGGSPMIRGFSSNRLLYAVDGVRMNSAIFRAGNIQNVISLDAFAIENTEVFFGPGSIMYGSDAIGGVMSFQTLTPQLSLDDKPLVAGKAVMRYSAVNKEKTGHFDVKVGWKKWAMVSSITHTDFDDLRMGTKGPEEYLRLFYVQRMDSVDRVITNPNPLVQAPTGYSQTNLMQKIYFKPNAHWDFQYGFHYSETSSYARYDRLIEQQTNGLPRSAVWNYGPQKWLMHQFTINHTQSTKLYDQMTIRLAQQGFEESRIDRNFSGGQRFRLRTNLEEVKAYSANVDFEKNQGNHKFYYGAEYVQNDIFSKGSATDIRNGKAIAVPDRYPNSTWKSYAVYLNYQWAISDKFLLQTGARYSNFEVTSDFTRHLTFFPFDFTSSQIQNGATTASIGAIYRPADTWKISLNGSTGFRAPNVDDIGKIFDFVTGEVVVPNTSLRAEYACNGELNISKIFGDVVKLDITGFYTHLDNAMVRRAFQVNGKDSILYNGAMSKVYAIQNASFAKIYGVNVGIEIKLPAGFSLSSRYNYQLGREEMDNGTVSRSRHAAPAFGVTRLSYNHDKLAVQLYVMYSEQVSYDNLNPEEQQKTFIYAKDENGKPYSPSWATLNFKAMYQLTDSFSVNAGLENITDQRYRPYSSGIVAGGRNFMLSLRAQF